MGLYWERGSICWLDAGDRTSTGKIKLGGETRCGFCGNKDVTQKLVSHWFLKFDAGLDAIARSVETQSDESVRNYLASQVRQPLLPWDVSRDNYLGTRMPNGDGLFVYMWYESLLAYAVGIGKDLDEVSFDHFLGKNIIYYHGIVWPFLLSRALGKDGCSTDLSARGFLRLDASDPEIVDIETALKSYDADFLRLYAVWKTPDKMADFEMRTGDLGSFVNTYAVNKIGSLLHRTRSILRRTGVTTAIPGTDNAELKESARRISSELDKKHVRGALLALFDHVDVCNRQISNEKLYNVSGTYNLNRIAYMAQSTLHPLYFFMPERAKDFDIFRLDRAGSRQDTRMGESPRAYCLVFDDVKWNRI
ncbi:class I tRNA ligase family protein [Candidatus Woesearchaeota archaeon]|nr:class I tRNA ligase family protein [Candidatus Woesearchaeota archaeon]